MSQSLAQVSTNPTVQAVRERQETAGLTNVGDLERVACGVVGALLVWRGLRNPSLGNLPPLLAGGALLWRGVTGHCSAYQALGISTAGKQLGLSTAAHEPVHHGILVIQSVTVNRPVEQVYRYWRDFTNLPRFMEHLKSVTVREKDRSHWVARAPLGQTVEWEAEILKERPNELIAWRSVEGSQIDCAGSVRFRAAPGGRGTEVTVELNYEPPAGVIGDTIARLFGRNPRQTVREDLRRFKQIIEAGEIPTASDQPDGRSVRRVVS